MTGFLMCVGVELCFAAQLGFSPEHPIRVPMLQAAPRIDGHLEDWKDRAFSNGSWDIHRLRYTPWYDPQRNRLTDHGDEPRPEDDLRARYYLAWDARYFYFGAEVTDNVNDVDDPAHEDKRWYYKDCICWFLEGPRDQRSEHFGQGDNAFCFVIDRRRPKYAAWWRHGAPGRQYIEEPIPPSSVDYHIRFNPWGRGQADFVLEARVEMASTLGRSDPTWQMPRTGHEYGLEIVHTDPDGGDYGGHFIIYGTGDDDASWSRMILSGPQQPVQRLPQ
tara:strand:- start:218 stop:1042 length:825 start_codon:yes stop_codon:yes gene_type:complete